MKTTLIVTALILVAGVCLAVLHDVQEQKDFNAWAKECRAKDGSVSIKAINGAATTYMCVDTLTNAPVGLPDMEA